MIKNNLKIALRFFLKNKLFTGINVLGLSIGITAFILLIRYVAYEQSYDDYLPGVDDLYRVTLTTDLGGKGFQASATNHPTVGAAMLEDFPEVESFTRIADKSVALSGTVILSYKNEQGEKIKSDARDENIYFANNTIISTFGINLRYGDSLTALTEPGTTILNSSIAQRFFGNEDPMGKMISINDGFALRVTGIFDDAPQNTHLPLGMVISYATFGEGGDFTSSWVWPEFYTYVKLRPGADSKAIESRFPAFAQKYLSDIMKEHGFEARFGLQPVRDIHLKSDLNKEISANNSEATLYFLMIVAAFIIGIALINFINLSTAKSMERAKEVGIKKVVGANRGLLIRQFIFESLVINFFAMLLSITLVSLFIPSFNTLVGLNVLDMGMWLKWEVWSAMLLVFIGGGLLAGLYPAFVLSGFMPVQVLKGSFHSSGKGLVLRKTLVVAQFAISIALVVGTYIVYKQFSYMQNQNLGFDSDHNLVVSAPSYADSTMQRKVETFKRELLQNPNIKSVAMSNEIPGRPVEWGTSIRKTSEGKEQGAESSLVRIDHDFFKTYHIPLLAGRDFTKEDATFYYDNNGPVAMGHRVVVNKSATKILGFLKPDTAINEKITFKFGPIERTATIVGVIDDYHQQSLHQAFEPMVFANFKGYGNVAYLTLNISGSVYETVSGVSEKYKAFFPNDIFNHFFINEYFNRQYQAETKFAKVCLWFSLLAIFIAALGLFGLGSHMAIQKTREISVRKVMGASVWQALLIIPKKLLGLVLLSGTIALPIMYFITKKWLNGYAFQIEMSIWMFLVPLLIVMVVAALAIVTQSLKTALINPAESLRNE